MRKSNTELTAPNSTMKRPMKRMFQRCGRSINSGSTASSAMPIAGTSDNRLFRRIWPASSGRNGRNSEAAAMLIMLPRFALIVVSTYFSVFAKVLRPSSMPRRMTSRLRSSRTKSAASLATSTACSTERLVSAACMAGASFTPSPRKPTTCPIFLTRQNDPLLLIRIHLDEEIGRFGGAPQRFVGQALKVAAGEHAIGPQADQARRRVA